MFLVACLSTSSSSCEDRSAVLDFSPSSIRVVTSPEVTLASTLPRESMGSSAAVSELFYSDAQASLDTVARSGQDVRFRAKHPEANLEALASALRFRGLVSARVDGEEIVASLSDEASAQSLEASSPGLATGPFVDTPLPLGERTLFASRSNGPPAELLAARRGAHWQLLVGGDIDVIPYVEEKQADYLKNFHDIRVRPLTSGVIVVVLANPEKTSPEARTILGMHSADVDESALHTDMAPTILMLADDESAVAQFRRLSNRVWRKTGVRPSADSVDEKTFTRRVLAADFEVVLAPVPSDLSVFLPWLIELGPLARLDLSTPAIESAIAAKNWQLALSLLDGYVRRLDEVQRYVAYNRSWCGEPDLQPNSWAWISELRRCEDVR